MGDEQLGNKSVSFKAWSDQIQNFVLDNEEIILDEYNYWNHLLWGLIPEKPSGRVSHYMKNSASESVCFEVFATELLKKKYSAYKGWGIQVVLLAAIWLAYKEWRNGEPLLLNIEWHGREPYFWDLDVSRTVGWFTSIYPIYLDFNIETGPVVALSMVRSILESIPYKGVGYGVMKYFTKLRSKKLFDLQPNVGFNYLGELSDDTSDSFLQIKSFENIWGISDLAERLHWIDISAKIVNKKLEISVLFDTHEFDSQQIQMFLRYIKKHIDFISQSWEYDIGSPESLLSEFSMESLEDFIKGIE